MKKKMKYIQSLDSLRALAVILVLGYHFRLPFFSGGFVGVDIFFVLSGYLITRQLIKELANKQTIHLKSFWLKRVRRLYPGLVTVLLVTTVVGVLKFPSLIDTLWQDDLAGIFGMSNWWYIIKKVPYADIFSKPTPLKHLWSLAIEAQFYLVFPLFLEMLYRLFKRKKKIVISLLIASALSFSVMFFLYTPADINRVYYGTDSRIFTLLLGAVWAYIYPEDRLNKLLNNSTQKILDTTSFLAFAGIVLYVVLGNEFAPFLYQGGFLLFTVLALIVLSVAIHPGTKTYQLLSNNVLVWIGKRSYSLYLWHYPILVLFTPLKITGSYHWLLIMFQLGLTFLISEMVYKYIETPLRRGNWQVAKKTIKQSINMKITLLEVLLLIVFLGGIFSTQHYFAQSVSEQSKQIEKTEHKAEETSAIQRKELNQIFMIGDSVMLGAKEELLALIPNTQIDADVGRQFYELEDLLKKDYVKKLNAQSLVVIGLGTNGPFSINDLEDIYQMIANKKANMLLINTRVPLNWQNQVNSTLKEFVSENQAVQLVDWYDFSQNHLALLENDGVHPNKEGHERYAELIKETINQYYQNEVSTNE